MSKSKLNFQERNYKMKKEYDADKLLVANLETIVGGRIHYGPIVKTTEQKYIFELKKDGKYREIFTGFLTDSVDESKGDIFSKYFDLPYAANIEPFTKYFPEYIGKTIPKLAFINIINDLNFSKKDVKTKK